MKTLAPATHLWLPEGWKFLGLLPILEPEFLTEKNEVRTIVELGQDVCQIASPDGRFVIDVGWYPDFDPDGQYTCVVVTTDGLPAGVTNPWDQPRIETFKTRSTAEVWRWLSRTTSDLYRKYYQ